MTSYKVLIKNILNKYIEYEGTTSNTCKYYCHTEFDSCVSNFEGLSNSNKIVIKTKIDIKFLPSIIKLFQCIYDSNYWIFEDDAFIDCYINSNNKLKNKLMKHDFDSWLYFLEHFITFDENDEICVDDNDKNMKYIDSIRIYNKIPNIKKNIYKSKISQKVYSLRDIIKLIN